MKYARLIAVLIAGAALWSGQAYAQGGSTPATAQNQTAVQAAAGSQASKATAVQGISGGVPISVISSGPGGSFPPDELTTGSINSATSNAAFTVNLANGEAVTNFRVTGLTASGATLTLEGSNDGGTTWTAISELVNGTSAPVSTLTVDGQFGINSGGRTNIRLRVSSTGTGTITLAANASTASSRVTIQAAPYLGVSPAGRTLVTLDIKTVTTGGTAVNALSAGHRTAGGWLTNPIGATINLCINEIGTATGTTSSGDTTCIIPGQTYTLAPAAGAVSVITSDSSHPFSGMGLQ